MNKISLDEILGDNSFYELTKSRRRLRWSLTITMFVIYFSFIITVAFNPLGLTAFGKPASIYSLLIPVALIVTPVVLIAIYVWRANTKFDRLTAQIAKKFR